VKHEHQGDHCCGDGVERRTLVLTAVSGGLLATGFAVGHLAHIERVETVIFALAIVCGGMPIAPKALQSALRLNPDMNLLMTVAVLGAAAIGQWHEAATVIFLFALAETLEDFSLDRARAAIRKLLDIAPKEALVKRNGHAVGVPVEAVEVGEVIVTRPGEKFPLDGEVVAGSSAVNQAPITGESLPVEKSVGDTVFAGSLNGHGALEVKVTRLIQDTTLARIIRMVEEAQEQRAPSQRFVDRFARYYTPAVLIGAVLVMSLPPLLFAQPFGVWFYRALVMLVIACPCALVISTPVAVVSGLASAARQGVLIKGGIYLEQAGNLKVIAFDKTGTLTKGMPEVTDVIPLNDHTSAHLLSVAAALESRSEHPLAQAVLRKAQAEGLPLPEAEDFQAVAGKGAKGNVEGRSFTLGSLRLFHELNVETRGAQEVVQRLQDEGKTTILLGSDSRVRADDHVCGVIGVADDVRPAAAEVIAHLRPHCVAKTVMLTGDNEGTARAIAQRVGIDEYRAELLPEDKVTAIRELLSQYGNVAMVGDGVNDAPALATATIGIAMGTAGSDTALETADIVLMADDLTKLPFAIHLSRSALRIIRFNIAFSLSIKGVFLLLALVGKATLWMAVAADMGASLLVIANSLRLLTAEPKANIGPPETHSQRSADIGD